LKNGLATGYEKTPELANRFRLWWPGTELDRRRQPFQGCSHPKLSVDSARHGSQNLPSFGLLIGARMEPSCTNLSLPRFASISDSIGFCAWPWFSPIQLEELNY